MESLHSLAFHAVGLPDPVSGLSILHATCIQGDTETAKFFLHLSPSEVDTIMVLGVPVLSSSSSPYKGKKLKDILELFDTPLHKSIQELLTLHCKGLEKWPPMYVAARHGNMEHINKLIARGCNNPAEDSRVLHLAAEYNSVEVVKELLHLGASLQSKNNRGYSAIHFAAKAGRTETVQYLLDSDISLRDAVGQCYHYTPLHLAAWQGHTETAATLIARGADVSSGKNASTYEDIHWSFKSSTCSDDFNSGVSDYSGDTTSCALNMLVTPILLAARQGHLDTFELLEQEGGKYLDNPVLFLAVKGGNVALLKKLFNAGFDVASRNCRDQNRTLLHVVNSEDVAEYLLDLGLDVMALDNLGRTPLHHAAYTGNIKLADVLIEHGADVSANTPEGHTPLVYAVTGKNCPEVVLYFAQKLKQCGKKKIANDAALAFSNCIGPDVARILLDVGFEVNKTGFSERSTPLHGAAEGDPETARLLVENGAKIHASDCRGETPFHRAARSGKLEVLRLLYLKDANLIKVVDTRKQTALHLACAYHRVECVNFLLDHGSDVKAVDQDGKTALHQVTLSSGEFAVTIAETLLKHDAKDENSKGSIVNGVNVFGATALHSAVRINDAMVKLLLSFGFSVNATDRKGVTPLHNTTKVTTFKLLLENGADSTIADNEGNTVLHTMSGYVDYVSNSSDEILEFLLDQRSADVNSRNARGMTPLHFAAVQKQFGNARILLEKSADVNAIDNDGFTALHVAFRTSHSVCPSAKFCHLLIENGADVNAMANNGCSPLHVAFQGRFYLTFFQLLIARGANVNAVDNQGNTVLHAAAGMPSRQQDVLSFLIEHGGDPTIANKEGNSPNDVLELNNRH